MPDYSHLDNPTQNYPCPIDLRFFQKKLDQLVGVSNTGRKWLRIVWGQSPSLTKVVCGQVWMKYLHSAETKWREVYEHGIWQRKQTIHYVGVPRFFIEELNPESQAKEAWEAERFGLHEGVWTDILGPWPTDGLYTPLFTIAYHDHLCCDGRGSAGGVVCYGAYREPSESDLQRLRRMKYLRDHPEADEHKDIARQEEMVANWQERFQAKCDEAAYEEIKPHAWRAFNFDPSVEQHGIYKFMHGHKGGLTEEERKQALLEKSVIVADEHGNIIKSTTKENNESSSS